MTLHNFNVKYWRINNEQKAHKMGSSARTD